MLAVAHMWLPRFGVVVGGGGVHLSPFCAPEEDIEAWRIGGGIWWRLVRAGSILWPTGRGAHLCKRDRTYKTSETCPRLCSNARRLQALSWGGVSSLTNWGKSVRMLWSWGGL